jgi:uncharacterized membrane protein YvbJ
MSYCPKCGNKVDETMTFCPNCGASLKMEQPSARPVSPSTYRRGEKSEKNEKGEKNEKNEPEKGEKHEKGGSSHVGWLIGGIVIIIIGLMAYLRAAGFFESRYETPIVLLIIGIAVIIIAVWLSMMARRRNPAPTV